MLIWIVKLCVASLLAFAALNLFAFFFYNYGLRVDSETGTTDYRWKEGIFSQAYEGFGYGTRDKYGFNNAFIPPENSAINIIVMGSSQMEASNVPYNKNTVYLLNEAFAESNVDLYAYNMAMEGHRIERQVNHLKKSLSKYQPKDYVVLETMDVMFSATAMEDVLDGNYGTLSYEDSSKLAHYAKKSPYVRLMYQQYLAAKNNRQDKHKEEIISIYDREPLLAVEAIEENGYSEEDLLVLSEFLDYIVYSCSDYGCKPAILYIPTGYIKDGDYTFVHDKVAVSQLEELCNEKGILLINLTDEFTEYYAKNKILPYGFSNTAYGEGHLNVTGHRIIADKLYKTIIEDMEGNAHAVQ